MFLEKSTDISYASSQVSILAPLQGFPLVFCTLDSRSDSLVIEEENTAEVAFSSSYTNMTWRTPKPRKVTLALVPNTPGADAVMRMNNRCYPLIPGTLLPPNNGITINVLTPQLRSVVFSDCTLLGGTTFPTGKSDGSFSEVTVQFTFHSVVYS